jgi:pimeloyl-ACP methyl ester carboxylesterase
MSPLAERWRVIAYDRHGCTRSRGKPYGKRGYFAHHAEDAAGLLRALGAAPASVLGWSSGGIVALALAVEHPELIERLVLYEPDVHLKKQMNCSLAALLLKTMLLGAIGRKRTAVETIMRPVLAQVDGKSGFDSLDEARREALVANADALLAELNAGSGEEMTEVCLRAMPCPVTNIVGGLSAPILVGASEHLKTILPAMRVIRVPNGNHLMPLERPAEFVRLLEQALSRTAQSEPLP